MVRTLTDAREAGGYIWTVVVIQVLLIASFGMSGAGKLVGGRTAADGFSKMRYPQWFRVLTGIVELVGAAGMVAAFWVPQAAVPAAAWMAATMVGGIYTDFVRTWTPLRGAFAAVLLALAVATMVLRLSPAA